MTYRALVDNLFQYRDAIHLFEDMETLFQDRIAAGILRSACGAPKGKPRIITYTTALETICFPFTGGVVVISNQNLAKNPVLGAIASRMRPLEWRLASDEMVALIQDIASKGYRCRDTLISPDECMDVAEFLLDQMGEEAWQVDLRTFCDHALPTYQRWQDGQTNGLHWTDLVKSMIQGRPVLEKRYERIEREQRIACECYQNGNNTDERLAFWTRQTGHKKQAFYDRLKEAKATGLFGKIVNKAG